MKISAPVLPLPRDNYERGWFDQYNRILSLFFQRLVEPGTVQATELYLTALPGTSTLAVTVSATATSFTLHNATNFPIAGSGTIEQEKFSWTGKTGNTLTGVTRGIVGTTAAPHNANHIVIASAASGIVYADPATRALYVNF